MIIYPCWFRLKHISKGSPEILAHYIHTKLVIWLVMHTLIQVKTRIDNGGQGSPKSYFNKEVYLSDFKNWGRYLLNKQRIEKKNRIAKHSVIFMHINIIMSACARYTNIGFPCNVISVDSFVEKRSTWGEAELSSKYPPTDLLIATVSFWFYIYQFYIYMFSCIITNAIGNYSSLRNRSYMP